MLHQFLKSIYLVSSLHHQITRRKLSVPFALTYCSAFCCFVSWLHIKSAVKILCLTWAHTTHIHSHRWFERTDMSQSCEQLLSGVYLGHVWSCGETAADSPPMQWAAFPLPLTVPSLWPLRTRYQPDKNMRTAFFSQILRGCENVWQHPNRQQSLQKAQLGQTCK